VPPQPTSQTLFLEKSSAAGGIDRFEAHYASMLCLCFRAVGADLAAVFSQNQRNLLALRAECA